MRGGSARGKSKKNDFILKKLKENVFIQKNFFSPFSLLALKRCEQPSCQVQPGPRYRRTARTRRSGRGTRDADIAPRDAAYPGIMPRSAGLMPRYYAYMPTSGYYAQVCWGWVNFSITKK